MKFLRNKAYARTDVGRSNIFARTAAVLIAFVSLVLTDHCFAQSANEELAVQASWDIPGDSDVEHAVSEWLNETGADETQRTAVLEQLNSSLESGQNRLDAVIGAVSVLRDNVAAMQGLTRGELGPGSIVFHNSCENDASPFVRDHVSLLYGKWLAQHELYDESLLALNRIDESQVIDPATLLFYRAVSEHQLLMKDECKTSVTKLLENADSLPRRYRTVGELILADIAPLESGSLDEIGRLMADIQRRQSLYRSGQRVLGQERDVIEKLDKMIEDLEAQQQEQQQQASSNQSSQPMEDSKNASGQGDGSVKSSQQVDGGQWGDLPPEDRAAALAEMSKDLPPHYRPVIEEYFRQLAEGEDR